METAIARNVQDIGVVAEEASWVAPGPNRIALTVQARLETESRVLVELLGAIVSINE